MMRSLARLLGDEFSGFVLENEPLSRHTTIRIGGPAAFFIEADDLRSLTFACDACRKLGIPIVAVTDTNCDPDVIDYIIPGNDDAIRAIKLFVTAMAEACLEGEAMRKDSKNKDAEEELKKAADAEAKAEEAPAVEAAAE